MQQSDSLRTASPDSSITQDAEALHDTMTALVRLYQFRDRDRICCHDVSVSQCYALETLVEQGPMRLQPLADHLMLDKSTASRLIDGLVKKTYAARTPDPEDARGTLLTITEAGRRLYAIIRADLVAQQQAVLADLPPDLRRAAIEVMARLARATEKRMKAPACGPTAC